MASPLITHDDVLQTLMNDGTIDAIRLKIINQLKANEELMSTTITLVEQSKVLNTPGAEKQTKRELFDALRQELESEALENASKLVWELIMDKDGFGKEINETVERVFCRLSGRDPPLFPQLESEAQKNEVNEKKKLLKEKVKEKEKLEKGKMKAHKKLGKRKMEETEKAKKKDSGNLESSIKKRTFNDMSVGIEGEAAEGSRVPTPRSSELARVSRTVSLDCGNSMKVDKRCKRTDGKTWRCTLDVIPGSKYCGKHIYRSSNRKKVVTPTPSKKKVKTSSHSHLKKEVDTTIPSKKEVGTTTRSKRKVDSTNRSKEQVEATTHVITANSVSKSYTTIMTPSRATTNDNDNIDNNWNTASSYGASPNAASENTEGSSPKAALQNAEGSSPTDAPESAEGYSPKAALESAEIYLPKVALETSVCKTNYSY